MKRRAFTLIELLIVVAIIGTPAVIVILNFLNAQINAKITWSSADMKTTTTATKPFRRVAPLIRRTTSRR